VHIRSAAAKDLSEIVALERSTPAAAHWSEDQYRNMLREGIPDRMVLVLEEEGTTLGFAVGRLIDSDCELENIAIVAERQRMGLGRALMEELTKRARNAAATSLVLEVRASNVAARALYEKLGFIQGGIRKAYYRDPEENAILYRLKLSQAWPSDGYKP
jgi:ribosomal-protein-alanine acetyltransferase